MRDLIAKGLSPACAAIAPALLLKEMLVAARFRQVSGFASGDAQDVFASGPLQAIFHRSARLVFPTMTRQGSDAIRFVVDRSREPGHETLGDDFALEDNTAIAVVTHVKPQIQLGEIALARTGHTENSRIRELKSNQTYKRVVVAC